MIRKTLRVLLPTYANDTLPPFSRRIVDLWLKLDDPARAEGKNLHGPLWTIVLLTSLATPRYSDDLLAVPLEGSVLSGVLRDLQRAAAAFRLPLPGPVTYKRSAAAASGGVDLP